MLDPDSPLPADEPDDKHAWGLLVAAGALVVSFTVAVIGAGVVEIIWSHLYKSDQTLADILAYQFLTAGVALSAVAFILIGKRAPVSALGLRFPGWNVVGICLLVSFPIVFSEGLLYLAFTKLFPGYHLQSNVQQLFGANRHVSVPREALILVWAAVEAPLTEEVLFRGIVFQGAQHFFARWLPTWLAVLIGALLSGLIFGLAHGEVHTLPVLVFLGVILAYVFFLSRSVYGSAIVHGVVNALAVLNFFGP